MKAFRIKFEGKRSAFYYGKLRLAPNKYKRVKLHDAKEGRRASADRLCQLQSEHDRSHGRSVSALTHAKTPIDKHVDAYFGYLKTQTGNDSHIAIARNTLNRLVKSAGWGKLADINLDSATTAICAIAATQSYRNQYVKRLKAFVNWCLLTDRIYGSPIRALRRFNERGSKRTRARRPATRVELDKLWGIEMPDYRRLAYALAACNGLRRNEIAKLRKGDIHLEAAVPFLKVRQKMGETFDAVPIHPYVATLLQGWQYQSDNHAFSAVPDVKTLKKDLKRAGVTFADSDGLRLDLHALRHTFATELDRAHTSRATKKRLLRHAASDVTDGYTHADLAESCEALLRIHSPLTRQLDQIPTQKMQYIPAYAAPAAQEAAVTMLQNADDLATLVCAGLRFRAWPDARAGNGTRGKTASKYHAFYDFADQKPDPNQRRRIDAAMIRLRALHAAGRIDGDAYAGLSASASFLSGRGE